MGSESTAREDEACGVESRLRTYADAIELEQVWVAACSQRLHFRQRMPHVSSA